jgi:transcriptional regulatory protein RtcR
MHLRRIGYSFLGVKLDVMGFAKEEPGSERRKRWRPTVAFCAWLKLDELRLIYQREHKKLADTIQDDLEALVRNKDPGYPSLPASEGVSPREAPGGIVVHHDLIDLAPDPWDLARLYEELERLIHERWLKDIEDQGSERFVHLRTGHTPAQIAMYQLALSGKLPARVVHTISPTDPVLPATARSSPDTTWGSCRVYEPDPNDNLGVALKRDHAALSPRARQVSAALHREKHPESVNTLKRDRFVSRVARVREPVLLLGATGTGKTTLARDIHEMRQRTQRAQKRSGDFVAVNCATLSGETVNSELFGHAKGAFTGAHDPRRGFLREADGGTLFLDEVGELPLDTQARLLKALDEKRFRPLGSTGDAESDFLLIAATNRDLREFVRERRFRDDLLCRLDVFRFDVPNLRERLDEFESLFDGALRSYDPKLRITPEARAHYLDFARSNEATWAGNFRDLRASAARLATCAEDQTVTIDDVNEELNELRERWTPGTSIAPRIGEQHLGSHGRRLSAHELAWLDEVKRVCRASRTQAEAGRRLFPESNARNKSDRLAKYLKRNGLSFEAIRVGLGEQAT